MIKNLEALYERLKGKPPKKVAVVWANEDHIFEAVSMAWKRGAIEPLFIGEPQDLRMRIAKAGMDQQAYEIIKAENPIEAAVIAVRLAREEKIEVIQKGVVETADLMRAVLNKQTGICESGVMSHLSLLQIESGNRLIAITDSALLTYPDLHQKAEEIRNAVRLLNNLGINPVKVAVLAAVEKVNPKMPETIDGAALKEMYLNGEFEGCIIEGPISYDLAMNPDAAKIKNFDSPIVGDADLLVVPNIVAGNLMTKALMVSAGAVNAGLIIGAAVPIVVSSRASSVQSKYTSLMAAVAAGNMISGKR